MVANFRIETPTDVELADGKPAVGVFRGAFRIEVTRHCHFVSKGRQPERLCLGDLRDSAGLWRIGEGGDEDFHAGGAAQNRQVLRARMATPRYSDALSVAPETMLCAGNARPRKFSIGTPVQRWSLRQRASG